MIRLDPTKTLVNEKRIDMVVPRPQRLLEHVQNFLEVAHKLLFPLLYKIFC